MNIYIYIYIYIGRNTIKSTITKNKGQKLLQRKDSILIK